jgi:ectoine hydroxylase-related dioxygenase (phytanoyl-CoA dioxygenase family)
MVDLNRTPDWSELATSRKLQDDLFRDGFIAVSHITDADEIQWIRDEIQNILADKDLKERGFHQDGDSSNQHNSGKIIEIHSPSYFQPRLLDSNFFKRALEVSRIILGHSAQLRFDHSITKPPFSVMETAWHQDCAYWRLTRWHLGLHWWLPLQNVTADNGCMHFIAASHQGPVLEHASDSKGGRALRTDMPVDAASIACPLALGGATIHLPKTLHYTGPNNSGEARHAWILQIGVKGWIPRILY